MKHPMRTPRRSTVIAALCVWTAAPFHAAPPPSRSTPAESLWKQFSEAAQADLTSRLTDERGRSFLKKFPAHPHAPGAQYAFAEREFVAGQYEKAAVGFQKFLQTTPSHGLADAAAFRLGECYYNLRVYNSAAAAWKRVTSEHPGSALWPDAMIGLSLLAVRRGAWGEADESLKALRARAPQGANREDARELQGLVAYHIGEFSESVHRLENLDRDGAAYYRGLSYFSLKLYTEAADALKNLPTRGPAAYRESAAFLKAESFFQARNYTLALREFDGFLKSFPNSPLAPHVQLRVAASHLLVGEPTEALRTVRRIANDRSSPEIKAYAQFIEGAAELARGNNSAAVDCFGRVADGGSPAALAAAAQIRQAWAFHLLGDPASAEKCLNRLEKTHPDSMELAMGQFLRGARLYEEKRWEDAGTLFEAAVLRFPYSILSEIELALMTDAFTRAHRADHLVTAANAALKILTGQYSSASPVWRAQSHYFIGQAYFDMGRFNDAIGHLSRVVTDYPTHPLAPRAELLLAWCWEEGGRHDKAREAAQHLSADTKAEKPVVMHAVFLDAVSYFNQKNYDKALARLGAFVTEYPQGDLTPEAQYLVGLGYHQKKVYGSAIEAWNKLIQSFPNDDRARLAYLHIGDLYFKAGKYAESADFLHRFQTRWPADPAYGERALWKEVQALFNGTDNAAAVEGYNRYLKLYPNGPNAPNAQKQREMVYYRWGEAGDPAKIETFLTLYPASPFAPSARYRLGAMAMAQSKWDRAVLEFEQFTRDYPKDPLVADAYFAMGQAYENRGDTPKSLLQYETLMERFPKTAQALDAAFRSGATHFAKERYKEAADAYEFAAHRKISVQQKANVQYNLALCYENLGRPDDAARAYALFARTSQDGAAAQSAELAAGVLSKKSENWALAEASFRRLLKRTDLTDEGRLQAVNLLAETQLAAGHKKQALRTYEQLSGMDPAAHDLRLAGLAQLAYQYEQDQAFQNAVRVYEQIAVSGGKAEWVQAARARVDALTKQMNVVP